jgi:hypothetical protein
MRSLKYISMAGIQMLCIITAKAQIPCDTITGKICRSIITDTAFNPYVTGVLGNWRANRSYTWYNTRTETDPNTETDIRRNGTFADFAAFWNFQDNKLISQPDTTRWVWNSEITLINRKGFEIENKDPLGRYNSGLYGYNLTMPTAVIQNSRYRESAFEGFEDYGYTTQICDTGCAANRHIDYSSYKSKIDTTQKHSGKSSLRLQPNEQVGLSFTLTTTDQDTLMSRLQFNTKQDACVSGGTALASIKSNNKILLPVFSPTKGARMVLSAWVKENGSCNCSSYAANRIIVAFSGFGNPTTTFFPTGNIIEGWQRYESIFDIPASGSSVMTVSLKADTATVYFDDLRIHPYNANMKSFVFHPVNLRLMAELDENNYSTFYEYDDDGTLIRLKKETERGIKTIKETRSALLKE